MGGQQRGQQGQPAHVFKLSDRAVIAVKDGKAGAVTALKSR
jgi:hypothetical protein